MIHHSCNVPDISREDGEPGCRMDQTVAWRYLKTSDYSMGHKFSAAHFSNGA
jgi:hypothetical protein